MSDHIRYTDLLLGWFNCRVVKKIIMFPDNSPDASPASRLLRYAVIALVLAFPAVCLLVNRGDSIGLGLLALLGLWVGFREGFARILRREDGQVALAFFAFFAVAVLSYEFGQATYDGFRFLGRDLRFLLIVPVLVLFRRYPPPAKTVFIGLAIGGLLTGVHALVGFLHAPATYRAQAETDLPIMFGDLTASIVLMLAAAYGLVVSARKLWLTAGFLLCLLSGLTAVILSGTRGAWVALLLLLPLLFGLLGRVTHKRYLALIVVSLLVLFAGTFVVSRTDVRSRLSQVAEQVALYRTALRTLPSAWKDNAGDLPFCNDQRHFLGAWLSFNRKGGPGEIAADVVRDPALIEAKLPDIKCPDGYALHITNNGKEYRWIGFPRTVLEAASPQHTQLIVRGNGIVFLDGRGAQPININTRHYRIDTLHGPPGSGQLVMAELASGQSLWLIPVDGYYGEYRYTLMSTSVGLRFEMWRAAWKLFLEHPVLGIGTGAFYAQTQHLAHLGEVAPHTAQYDHPHSDYFDALASRGVLGLLALFALLGVPAIYFVRALKSPEDTSHAVGLAGLLLVCGFAICGLTDTVFIHSMNISWYVIYIALFMALLKPGSAKAEEVK